MTAKHSDNHLHIRDLTGLYNSLSYEEIFESQFAGNETEAAGHSALTEPAGGAPGVCLTCTSLSSLCFHEVVTDLGYLSFTYISTITAGQNREGRLKELLKAPFCSELPLSCLFLSTLFQPPVLSVLEKISQTYHLYPIPLHDPNFRLLYPPLGGASTFRGFLSLIYFPYSQLIFQVAAKSASAEPSCRPLPLDGFWCLPTIIQEPRLHSWDQTHS